jgi:fructose-1,6-bisphosphatase/inositol monophosphatase family enzyme
MTATRADIDRFHAFAEEAARDIILPHFARLDASEIRTKAHASDFVTVADEGAERLIEKRVRETYGDVLFVGEEIMERDPSLADRLPTAERAVVVDPIDGTFNYANGIPAFAVILSLIERGEVKAGVIYDPIRGDAACALAGGGAWIQGGGRPEKPLRVASPVPLEEMLGSVAWAYAPAAVRQRMLPMVASIAAICNYRSGAQEVRLLASGGMHFGFYWKLSPWDHAAPWLIHREAGGYSALVDGSPYRPELREGGLLLAPDKASWTVLAEAIGGA